MADPTDEDALGIVRRKSQKRVRPAVAGPTEISRAVRTLYAAAGGTQPEPVQSDKLAAIEIESGEDDSPFEVVNVADDIKDSPLSRIAKELGVEVPPDLPSRGHMDVREQKAPAIPPKTNPDPPRQAPGIEVLLTPATQPGPIASDDLSEEDLAKLEAIRSSLEKGALVLRTVAELCVEKGTITREEIKKRKPPTGPVKPA